MPTTTTIPVTSTTTTRVMPTLRTTQGKTTAGMMSTRVTTTMRTTLVTITTGRSTTTTGNMTTQATATTHAGHDHAGPTTKTIPDDHSGHDHGHDHAHDLRGASKRSLIFALVLISTYMVAEVIGGILSGSLALLADAGHMLTDAAAIVMALVAMYIAQKEASVERTFGYHRTEILAALANTFALWAIAGWIVFEAYHRVFREDVDVVGFPVLIVGIGGFLINLAAAWVLHRSSGESLNVEGAFQHVIADLLGSVGVIVSAILIMAFEWHIADPILSVVIALLIVYNTRRLILSIVNVLLEGVPGAHRRVQTVQRP